MLSYESDTTYLECLAIALGTARIGDDFMRHLRQECIEGWEGVFAHRSILVRAEHGDVFVNLLALFGQILFEQSRMFGH